MSSATTFTTHTAVAAGIDLFPPDLVARYLGEYAAGMGLDLCVLDMAGHCHQGVYAASRGRTYAKDKVTVREGTFALFKLLFDDTDHGWTSSTDTGATYLAGAQRYRVPDVIRRIAVSEQVATIRERHGVPIDPHEPLSPDPQRIGVAASTSRSHAAR